MKGVVTGLMTIIVSMGILSITLSAPKALAVNIFPECSATGAAHSTDVCTSVGSQSNNHNSSPILKIMKTVINVLSYIIGVAAIIVLIIAGLEMIIGGDNAQSVATARNTMIYALIGIVVAVLAQSIVVFVLDKIG